MKIASEVLRQCPWIS